MLLTAEPPPRHARALAISTGTIGLLAVGLLMVSVTPKRSESPIAISASTTPVALAQIARPVAGIQGTATLSTGRDAPAERAVDEATGGSTTVRRPVALAPTPTAHVAESTTVVSENSTMSLATPLGDGRFGIVTRASLSGERDLIIDVRLPSGRTTVGEIVTASDDAAVVALAAIEPGHDIATDRPGRDEIVTVMVDPPVEVAYDQIEQLDIAVDEGTAVIDERGDLVGICTHPDETESVELIEVVAALDDATTAAP